METEAKTTQELIEQLQSHQHGARFVALGRLIERGEPAIPLLTEALYHPDKTLRIRVACALAGIGATDASVVLPIADLWEELPADSVLGEAFLVVVRELAARVKTEDIPVLTRLLDCYKKTPLPSSSAPATVPVGLQVTTMSAGALETLAKRSPTRELLTPLAHLPKGGFFSAAPAALTHAHKVLDEATKQWQFDPHRRPHRRDLPVPAEKSEKIEASETK